MHHMPLLQVRQVPGLASFQSSVACANTLQVLYLPLAKHTCSCAVVDTPLGGPSSAPASEYLLLFCTMQAEDHRQ
jgi:hypothetical protein